MIVDSLSTIRQEVASCHQCALCEQRKQAVFGDGNPQSPLLFVGEGPGATEDEQGIPFVGAAGQLLDDMLELIDLDRTKYYITNIVKCRPPQNRDPLGVEQETCLPYLRRQVKLIRPRLIVCLGRIAAMKLLNPDFKITKEHGIWIEKGGIHMMAMYHPSALLRDVRKRPEAFEDLKSLRDKIRSVCPELYEQ